MSIPVYQPSSIANLILDFGSKFKFESTMALSSGLQATFYESIRSVKPESNYIVKAMCTTAVEYFHYLQATFNLVNTGLVIYGAKTLAEELCKRSFSNLTAYSTSVATSVALLTLGYYTIRKDTDAASTTQMQKFAKMLQITQIGLSTILACVISENRFWYALSALGSAYSFLKNSQISWLTISQKYEINGQNVKDATVSYKMLRLPSEMKGECPTCTDEGRDKLLNTAFCTYHVAHEDCIKKWIETNKSEFIKNAKATKVETKHYTNGVYTHTTYHYNLKIHSKNLPSCQICREQPRQNYFDAQITDQTHGKLETRVILTYPDDGLRSQPLFEKLNAAYSIVQASLAFLQRNPQLAASIFRIQKFMLVTDVISLGFTYYYLYQRVSLKWKLESTWSKVALATSMVGLTAVSCLLVFKLGLYWKSAVNLNDVLKSLPVSEEVLKQVVSISWNAPTIHKVIQTLYLNRAIANFGLSYFTNLSRASLASAAAQVLSLVNISLLPWIEVVKRVTDGPMQLSNLTVTGHFMTYANCIKNPLHLQTTVKSIVDYMSQIFKDSSWYSFWNVTYQNGIEVSRQLVYRVTPQNISLEACGCTLKPYMGNLYMTGYNFVYQRFPTFQINFPSYFY